MKSPDKEVVFFSCLTSDDKQKLNSHFQDLGIICRKYASWYLLLHVDEFESQLATLDVAQGFCFLKYHQSEIFL